MKKILGLLSFLAIFAVASLPSSASVSGFFYQDTTEAGGGDTITNVTKVGSAQCRSYFGVVAMGDCSIEQAAKNGNIRNIAFFDRTVNSIVGFRTVTVKVYGN